MQEDCGWWEGWGSATIRAVSDASCRGEELRTGTEAANSAWAPAAGAKTGIWAQMEMRNSLCYCILGKEPPYLPEIKKTNKQIQTCLCPKHCNSCLRTVLSV